MQLPRLDQMLPAATASTVKQIGGLNGRPLRPLSSRLAAQNPHSFIVQLAERDQLLENRSVALTFGVEFVVRIIPESSLTIIKVKRMQPTDNCLSQEHHTK